MDQRLIACWKLHFQRHCQNCYTLPYCSQYPFANLDILTYFWHINIFLPSSIVTHLKFANICLCVSLSSWCPDLVAWHPCCIFNPNANHPHSSCSVSTQPISKVRLQGITAVLYGLNIHALFISNVKFSTPFKPSQTHGTQPQCNQLQMYWHAVYWC